MFLNEHIKIPKCFWGHSNLPNIQNHSKMTFQHLPTTHITAATLSHKDLTLSFTVLLIGTKKRMGEVLRSSRKRGNVVPVQPGPSKNNQQLGANSPHLYQPSPLIAIILWGKSIQGKPGLPCCFHHLVKAKLLSQILQKPPPFHLSWGNHASTWPGPEIMYLYVHFLWQVVTCWTALQATTLFYQTSDSFRRWFFSRNRSMPARLKSKKMACQWWLSLFTLGSSGYWPSKEL